MYINSKRAQSLMSNKNAKMFDMRSPIDFRNGSLPTAENLSLRNLTGKIGQFERKVPLIFFGTNKDDAEVRAAYNYATQMGFSNVFVLDDMNNWS